jgi:hypothetical protein
MPVSPTNIAQSLAGLGAAERVKVPAKKDGAAARRVGRRGEDELIVGAEAVEATGKVRPLAGNTEEEAREDRESGEGTMGIKGYTARKGGKKGKGEEKPRLDVAG